MTLSYSPERRPGERRGVPISEPHSVFSVMAARSQVKPSIVKTCEDTVRRGALKHHAGRSSGVLEASGPLREFSSLNEMI